MVSQAKKNQRAKDRAEWLARLNRNVKVEHAQNSNRGA